MKIDKIVPVITIDGPSGTGKGTICHKLAAHLKWHLLDSGSLYRVLAYAARKNEIAFDDIPRLVSLANTMDLRFESQENLPCKVILDGVNVFDELRTEQCGQDASKIAVIAQIREALLQKQRDFAKLPGLVTDGRDMGTVVFPNAKLKIFLTASSQERANRRYFQLKDKGIDVSLAQVIDELAVRDARDTERTHAPLKPAEDAIEIDTTGLSIVQVFDYVLKLIDTQ